MGTRSKKNAPLGGVPACGDYQGSLGTDIQGMIDGHTQINGVDTYPKPLLYSRENECHEAKVLLAGAIIDGAKIGKLATPKVGNSLVKLNTNTFKQYKKDIPRLIIASTMDMEFAHIDGYKGKHIYQQRVNGKNEKMREVFYTKYGQKPEILSDNKERILQNWEWQIKDTEKTVTSNPLHLFPMFCYDPRRYCEDSVGNDNCLPWDEPFSRIATDKNSGLWLGFYMHPALGFRPFDEKCKKLNKFYKECMKDNIPILVHCAPDGIITHDAKSYQTFDVINNRLGESSGLGIEYFHENYGHPNSWRSVLNEYNNLHLCLAHFGGSEWGQKSMKVWANSKCNELPPSTWIRNIIELTRDYDNVYTDVSCINIYDNDIKLGLKKVLTHFAHLRNKLIFGTGWYLLSLVPYSVYCEEYKKFFDDIDGNLWERVSLINPWNCYSLSKNKFKNIHTKLPQTAKLTATLEKLLKLDEYVIANSPNSSSMHGGSQEVNKKSEYECICKVKTLRITKIHQELGCRHYEEIRKLINKSNAERILSEDGLYLFNSMESGMSVIKSASFKYVNDEDCVNARDNVYVREKTDDRPWGGVCFNRRAYGETESECGKVNGNCVKIESECRQLIYPCDKECTRRANYSFDSTGKGIFTNIDDDANGKVTHYTDRSTKTEEQITSEYRYQSTLHELWHSIDFLLGKRCKKNGMLVSYPYSYLYGKKGDYEGTLINAFKTDMKKITDEKDSRYYNQKRQFNVDIKNKCFYDDIYDAKSTGKSRDNEYSDGECIYLFDIIEGISHCFVRGYNMFDSPWTSRTKYWREGGAKIVATEYFAAVGGMTAAGNKKGLALMKKYLPESYSVYTAMIRDAAEAIRTKNISLLYPL